MPSKEPKHLRRGRLFHRRMQADWLETIKDGKPCPERTIKRLNGRNGRIDVLVEDIDDLLSVVEIKSTDWDEVQEQNVTRNVKRQIHQIWSYVDALMENECKDVCPGIIFPRIPRDPKRLALIESLFNEAGVQVVWHNESIDALKERMSDSDGINT